MTQRVYNFSSGPAHLPDAVLKRAQAELLDWQGSGMSVMEVSHRSKAFMAMAEQSTDRLRQLLAVPDNYRILFLPGGARTQFAMIPMNLLRGKKQAGYLVTGNWSKLAAKEAELFMQPQIVTDSAASQYTTIAPVGDWDMAGDLAYLHYTDNETVHGMEFPGPLDVPGSIPLVADMSSNLLSREIDVSRFGLIYACAQKNLGPAGVTIVIVRDDLIGEVLPHTPSMLNYQAHAEKGSLLNTPPCFPWYMVDLMLQWLEGEGGVAEMGQRNARKAATLYDYLDQQAFYHNPVDPVYRSRMNVIFTLPTKELEATFIEEAAKADIYNVKGHRAVGGMRVALYNAIEQASVEALVQFMDRFAREHG